MPSSTATAAAPSVPSQALSPAALITALFSGPSGRGKGGEAKVLSGGTYGGAAAGEPIRVIVEEAKSPIAYRAARFVFVTLLYGFLIRMSSLLPLLQQRITI